MDLQVIAAERIADFKVPEHIWLQNEALSRNANGKFLKRRLRELLLEP